MARITVEDCLRHENNRFALVQLSSKRTRQILNGAQALVFSKNKSVVTALREIADGVVRFKTEEDLAKEREQEEARLKAAEAELPQVESTNGTGESDTESNEGGDDSSSDETPPAA